MAEDLVAAVRAWIESDPDPDTRSELEALVAAGPAGRADLADRFSGRLEFGTAGLRGAIGGGPMRMNRVVVRRAAAGLARWLLDTDRTAPGRGVVIGYDARHKSDVFAADSAAVIAAAGVPVSLLSGPLPTPVLAYTVAASGAASGVMVTASHNPPADNGYKVYLPGGRQIVAPIDEEISACIDSVGPTAAIPLAPPDDPLIRRIGDEAVAAYLDHAASVRLVPGVDDVRVAYTPMHGVGGEVALAAFARAGLPAPTVVATQFVPDADFPTVSFPNPEEPGAMDLLLAAAVDVGADVAIANDPDADRLGVAVPIGGGRWRRLNGDEIGWLLADHILRHTNGADRLVVTTLVSSSLLGRMAAAAGIHYAETFTGFKWIAKTVIDHPDDRFVFGYEQALGYLVADRPLDKDGITAAVLFAELVAVAKAAGTTVTARLDELAARYGRHLTAERSVRMAPADMPAAMAALRRSPPATLAGAAVTEVADVPEAGLLRLRCGPSVRVQIRPSGTEPKVKIYAEVIDGDPEPYLAAAAALLA